MLTVETERLRLIACPGPVARVVVNSRRQAEALLGLRLHDQWPGDDIRGYLSVYAQQVDQDPSRVGWGIWLMAQHNDRVVMGDVGFKGKPDASGTVDLGYGVVPSYRQQGYAVEAARALVNWAFAQPGVRRVTADCLPENRASYRVLEKLGMRQIGQSSAGLLLWELFPPR